MQASTFDCRRNHPAAAKVAQAFWPPLEAQISRYPCEINPPCPGLSRGAAVGPLPFGQTVLRITPAYFVL
jgi:hypothetical protein